MNKLSRIKEVIEDTVVDVESLVVMLELTIEDILDRHPDAVLDNAHKFGDFDEEDEGTYDEGSYKESWDED